MCIQIILYQFCTLCVSVVREIGQSVRFSLTVFLFLLFLVCRSQTWAAVDQPLRSVTEIDTEYESEIAFPVTTARILNADFDLIRRDFPQLRNHSNAEIENQLLQNVAVMAQSQVAQTEVNNPISTIRTVPIEVYRPKDYGRALMVKFQEGLIDAKGTGALNPLQAPFKNGLLSLKGALREFVIEKIVSGILSHESSPFKTVGCYGVIDLGFDIVRVDGRTERAGILLRQAANRKMEEFSFSAKEIIQIEPLLRKYGLTSTEQSTKLYLNSNIQGDIVKKSIVDFGHYRVFGSDQRPVLDLRRSSRLIPSSATEDFTARALIFSNSAHDNQVDLSDLISTDRLEKMNATELLEFSNRSSQVIEEVLARIQNSKKNNQLERYDPKVNLEKLFDILNAAPVEKQPASLKAVSLIPLMDKEDSESVISFYQRALELFNYSSASSSLELRQIFFLSLVVSANLYCPKALIDKFFNLIDLEYLKLISETNDLDVKTDLALKYLYLVSGFNSGNADGLIALLPDEVLLKIVTTATHKDLVKYINLESTLRIESAFVDYLLQNPIEFDHVMLMHLHGFGSLDYDLGFKMLLKINTFSIEMRRKIERTILAMPTLCMKILDGKQ